MTNRLIILRRMNAISDRESPTRHSLGPGFAPLASTTAGLRVEFEDNPSRKVLSALVADSTVADFARAVPMKLIEPFDTYGSHQPSSNTLNTWGVEAVGALASPYTGAGVCVAVLDTGIDAGHEAFAGIQIEERDFTGAGNGDHHGHGTHCAGTIFGRALNGCRIGVAHGVTRALIGKVLGGPSGDRSDVVIDAIWWAHQRGASVISMSLGMDFPGFVKKLVEEDGLRIPHATSIALDAYTGNVRMFERLANFLAADPMRPVLIVAAAGNENGRDEIPPFQIYVAPPAASPGIVAVGALGQNKGGMVVAPFSNSRPTVSAPGVDILSARSGGGVRTLSGTSMAAPHVAGVAALWAEKLTKRNTLTTELLNIRVIGAATLQGFHGEADPLDVGAGLVQAPRD